MHFRNILRFAQHVGDVLPAEETRPAVSVADGLGQQFWDLNGIYTHTHTFFCVDLEISHIVSGEERNKNQLDLFYKMNSLFTK